MAEQTPAEAPTWLLDLVHAAETAADETGCNGDHEGNDGCDGCAWAGLVGGCPGPAAQRGRRAREQGRCMVSETTEAGPVLGEEARQEIATALLIEYTDPEEGDAKHWQHRQADDAADEVLSVLTPHVADLIAAAEQRGRDETEEERADLERQNIELGRASSAEQRAHRRALAAAEQERAEVERHARLLASALNVALAWHDGRATGDDKVRAEELSGCQLTLDDWTSR